MEEHPELKPCEKVRKGGKSREKILRYGKLENNKV